MIVIIVLGAQNDGLGRLSPMALERANGALRIYRTTPGSKVLVTGGFGHFNGTRYPHAHYMAEHLVEEGVRRDDLLSFAVSKHTVDDAVLSRNILGGINPGTVHVVTSRLHVARAQLIFGHFFDPRILHFSGTADAVDDGLRRQLESHERHAIQMIREQGGILVDDILVRTPRMSNS